MSEQPEPAEFSENRGPHILELRIHGIANTPPEIMLGVPREEIVSVAGDELGGFWTYKKAPVSDPEAGDRNTPQARTDDPDRIRTEAYSWGNMVRSGGSLGSAIISIFVQIGWLLTLPFAFCNVAYWTRRISRKTDGDREWLTGPGAGTIRLFALGLTLLLTSALATVALDLVGTQCFRANGMCAGLPEIFQILPRDAHGRPLRLALLSLGVLAAMPRRPSPPMLGGGVKPEITEMRIPTTEHGYARVRVVREVECHEPRGAAIERKRAREHPPESQGDEVLDTCRILLFEMCDRIAAGRVPLRKRLPRGAFS